MELDLAAVFFWWFWFSSFLMFQASLLSEADALLEFKKGLNDTEDVLPDWNVGNKANMCEWTGISCDSSTKSHVVSIQLTALLLQGSITPSIGGLPWLTLLNLSRNYYMSGSIPYEITNCSFLEVLDLSYNLFTGRIPDFLGRLSRLRYLSLRWNYYGQPIPPSLANCSALEVLDLSRNQLSGLIPESLGRLALLQNLSVADNTYIQGTLPRSLSNCSSMVGLRLRNNMLSGEVPAEFLRMPSLVTLGISQNQFTAVEPGAYSISRILEFNLTDNPFNSSMDDLLEGITQMRHLQILALGEFQQQLGGEIPAALLSIKSLVCLDLAKNSFNAIPQDSTYIKASNLQYLDIRFNKFRILPSHAFKFLSSLKVLRLGSNQLTSIPPDLFTQASCSLEAVDMSNNEITGSVPATLGDCPSLKGLDLSNNKLQGELPDSIGQLRNLTYLVASRNQLKGRLPSQIGLLEKLNYLDLSWNNFSGPLWRDYSSAEQLQQFDVSHNNLTGGVPPGIGNLTRLVRLDLSNNLLSGTVPWELGRCVSIKRFDLSDNSLNGTLPISLQNLTQLSVLNVGMNNLSGEVNIDFGATKNLVVLQLGQNSFTGRIPASLTSISLQRHQVQVTSQTRRHDFFLRSLCSGMQAIDFRENDFVGSIPLFFCKWTCLMVLSLADNNLDGTIPFCITNMTSLQVLDFSSNKLTGVLPERLDGMESFRDTNVSVQALGMISKTPEWYNFGGGLFEFGITLRGAYITTSSLIDSFTFLDVSNNRLKGGIPPKLAQLVGLMHLNLSSNDLSGNIPGGLSNLTILESLDLSRNRFQGPIPEDIAWVPHMSSFSVAQNNLSGPIPTANNLNTRFPDAFQGNSRLCGFPLDPCNNTTSGRNVTESDDDDHDESLMWGFCSSAVPSFVVVFFIVVFTDCCQRKLQKVLIMKSYKKWRWIRQRPTVQNNSSMDMTVNAIPQHWSVSSLSSSVVDYDH